MDNYELTYFLKESELVIRIHQDTKTISKFVVNNYLVGVKENDDLSKGITFISSETGLLRIIERSKVIKICSSFGEIPSGYLEFYLDKTEKIMEQYNNLKKDLKCLKENDFELY